MIAIRLAMLAWLAALLAADGLLANAPDKSWVGEVILPTKVPKEIKFWDATGKKESPLPLYSEGPFQVRGEEEDRLRIHDGRREGWVAKKDFVVAREAIDYFQGRVDDMPKDGWALYMLGSIAFLRGEHDDAIARLTSCLKAAPNLVEAHVKRGQALQAKDEYEKALKDMDAAVRLAPKSASVYRQRGTILAARAGKSADDENAAKAFKDFAEAIRLDPDDVEAYFQRGRLLLRKGDKAAALKEFDEIVRVIKDEPYGYLARSSILKEMKKYDLALKDLDEAVRVAPKKAVTLEARGNLLHFLKQYDRAIKDFDAILAINPQDAITFAHRGFAKCGKKEFDKAVEDYDRALEIDAEESWAGLNRPVALLLARKEGAVDACRKFLEVHGENHRLSMYARIFGHFAARHEGAKESAKDFLVDGAKRKDLWPAPVMAFLRGDIDADALLEKAKTNGEQTEAHCYLGFHHALKGDSREATRHLRWVVDNGDPGYIEFIVAGAELDRLKSAKR